jgi:hypothetical protein
MNRWRVGEDRGSKETDGCPLTVPPILTSALFPKTIPIADDFPEVDSPIVIDFPRPTLLIP